MNQWMTHAANVFAVALACLSFYIAGWGIFDSVWVSGLTVWLGCMAGFLSIQVADNNSNDADSTALASSLSQKIIPFFHILLAVVFSWILWKWVAVMLEQEEFFIEISFFDNVLAWAGISRVVLRMQRLWLLLCLVPYLEQQ